MLGPDAGGVSEVWARGRSRLARLLSLAALGQWVSYYVAMLQRNRSVAGADAHRGEAAAGDAARMRNARALESARNPVLE